VSHESVLSISAAISIAALKTTRTAAILLALSHTQAEALVQGGGSGTTRGGGQGRPSAQSMPSTIQAPPGQREKRWCQLRPVVQSGWIVQNGCFIAAFALPGRPCTCPGGREVGVTRMMLGK
jgi:hypothetical protein